MTRPLGAAAKRSGWRSLGLPLGIEFGGGQRAQAETLGTFAAGLSRARPLVAPAPNKKITAARCIQTRTTDAAPNRGQRSRAAP